MKTRYITLVLILTIAFIGCTKFVEIQPPTTQLVTANVFSDNSAATAAQTTIYSMMANNNESGNMAIFTGLQGDELTNYQAGLVQFYTNALSAPNGLGPWNNAYYYIYQANAVIAGIQGNASLAPAVVQQLLGEAKFIRAFWYFYLTNHYGDVPLALTPDYNANAFLKRSARSDVYLQIISDLQDAEKKLNSNYVDASDTTITTTDRNRPTKWAALSLLARVNLYLGNNNVAESEADSVIGNNLYSLCPDLNNVFLVNSPEAIWQIGIPQPSATNTYDAFNFILMSEPGPSGSCCAISPQLLNSFETGDNRRINWIDSFQTTSVPVLTYYYPYKYKVYTSTVEIEDVMALRLAEQYLIRAEARTKQNNVTDAVVDLNAIRNRAGLANYNGSMAQDSVMRAILHERQVELFTEWGHRWFDLIRTGVADTLLGSPGNLTQIKSSGTNTWSSNDALYPIPQSEITKDPNLTQNPGY
jgi:starch-binding outer membrane protein, SusD/RagB family